MTISFILRRLLLFAIIGGPQWFWFSGAFRFTAKWQSKWLRWLSRLILILTVAAIVLVLCYRITGRILPQFVSIYLSPLIQLWVFTSIFAFLWLFVLRLAASLFRALRHVLPAASMQSHDPTRRSILRYGVSAVGSVPFVAALYGYTIERHSFEVVRVDLPVLNLPKELQGLRILQLSDIHVGDLFPVSEVRRVVAMAKGLDANLAVITGDFLSGRGDPLEECIAELSLLKAPLGVWGCNGNHEIYASAEDEAERLFHLHGMRLLRQSAVQLGWNGGMFNLIGVDYQRNVPFTGSVMPTLHGIEPLVRSDMPNILLSHNPNTFYRAAELGIEVSLAGHTHGGQVNIEIIHSSWNAARFMTRFIAGSYQLPISKQTGRSKDAKSKFARLYVNRGLGTLAVPARIGAPPEITLLTLQPG